jgi:hypothetical protein
MRGNQMKGYTALKMNVSCILQWHVVRYNAASSGWSVINNARRYMPDYANEMCGWYAEVRVRDAGKVRTTDPLVSGECATLLLRSTMIFKRFFLHADSLTLGAQRSLLPIQLLCFVVKQHVLPPAELRCNTTGCRQRLFALSDVSANSSSWHAFN